MDVHDFHPSLVRGRRPYLIQHDDRPGWFVAYYDEELPTCYGVRVTLRQIVEFDMFPVFSFLGLTESIKWWLEGLRKWDAQKEDLPAV